MKPEEIKQILNSNNFTENMENYIVDSTTNTDNPFSSDKVNNKLILKTIVHCTLVLATLLYIIFNDKKHENN